VSKETYYTGKRDLVYRIDRPARGPVFRALNKPHLLTLVRTSGGREDLSFELSISHSLACTVVDPNERTHSNYGQAGAGTCLSSSQSATPSLVPSSIPAPCGSTNVRCVCERERESVCVVVCVYYMCTHTHTCVCVLYVHTHACVCFLLCTHTHTHIHICIYITAASASLPSSRSALLLS